MQQDTEDDLPLSGEDMPGENLPLVEVEELEPRPPSRRKRLGQVGMGLAAVLAVFLVFHGVLPPGKPPAPAPTPRPTLVPSLALFASNVNFGAMVINNRAYPKQPVLLPITQDMYTVTLAAAPFRSVTCRFDKLRTTEPDTGFDPRCQVQAGDLGIPTMTLNGVTGSPTMLIGIALGLEDLPPDQQAAVRSIITSQVFTLHQQTTVPTGDYYAAAVDQNGKITSRRATRPLQAELSLVSPLGIPGNASLLCKSDLTCPGPVPLQFSPAPPADGWLIGIATAVRWRFTTSGGQVMGEATYLSFSIVYRYLTYGATSGWRLDEITARMIAEQNELGNQDCVAGGNILETLRQDRGFSYQVGTSIEGCILTLNTGAASQETFLWRFGVLLAVDQAAHLAFPALPVAPKDEVTAAGG